MSSARPELMVFDMDGVLVEVTESYRAAIQATVRHFTGDEPSNTEIQDWKNSGGWNDDWLLSRRMIEERGKAVTYKEVVDYFQKVFLGDGSNGLIQREQWIGRDGLFERLSNNRHLAVFTGRLHDEAMLTLDRFAPGVFGIVIGADEVTKTKPDPEGLITIRDRVEPSRCWYVGDSVDDARASLAAKVPFIGIASPSNPRYRELTCLLREHGAIAVIDDINSLEETLAAQS